MKPTPRGARRFTMMWLGLTALSGLAGCSNPLKNSAPRSEYFVLRDLTSGASMSASSSAGSHSGTAGSAAATPRVLMITAGASPTLFDSERMVFSPDGVSRTYYHFANWSERPGRSIVGLAEARLARDPAWKSVVSPVAGVRGDLLLTLKLEEFTHDDSVKPGIMQVAFTAELMDWRQRTLVQRKRFERSVTVEARNAAGAAEAANRAVTRLLDELSVWTRDAALSPPK